MVTLMPKIWFGQVLVPFKEVTPLKFHLHVLVFHMVLVVVILCFQLEAEHSDVQIPLDVM